MQTSTFDGSPSAPRHACVQSQGDPEAGRSIPRLDLHDGHAGLRLTHPATPMTARLESNQPRPKWALRGEVRSPLPRPAIRLRQRCLSRKSAPHGMDHHAVWACGARRLQKATKAGVCGRGIFWPNFGIFPITPKLRTESKCCRRKWSFHGTLKW